MTTISAALRLRPTRIGFLVNPVDMASVRHIMQVCTCLWGGIYNPIIPVCATLPEAWKDLPFQAPSGPALANGYIDFFEPDVFVEAEAELAKGLNIAPADISFSHSRVTPLGAYLDPAIDDRERPPAGLNVFGLYKALYEREFKFVTRHDQRVALFEGGEPEDLPFCDAVSGGFPRSGMLEPLAGWYREVFAPQVLLPSPETWVNSLQQEMRFPLHFTQHSLERGPDGGLGEPTLFVVDPGSPLDLIDLWNVRLYRRHVIPINLRWFAALTPFMRDFITRNHRPLRGNPHGVMTHTTLEFGRSIGQARAQAIVNDAQLVDLPPGSWQFKVWYDRIWTRLRDDHVWGPRRARVTATSTDLELTVADDKRERSVQFATVSPDFASSYHNSPSAWVNVLNFHSYRSAGALALSLPGNFAPSSTTRLRLGGVALMSREGFVLPQQYKGHGEYLRMMSGGEAMTDWLKQRGTTGEISSSGRVAEQVMDSLGGFGGVRLLADRETIQRLDKMAKSVKKYTDGTVEEYQDRTAAATDWVALLAKRAKDMWSGNLTLDRFVDANILKLGLALVCTHCTCANWYGIGELREQLTCERCRKEFKFPQGSIGFKNTPWKFRVVGPFSVPEYANGAYATALTLRVFAETLASGHASLVYSPGLNISASGQQPFEVDFSFWYRRDSLGHDDEETVTVFGEAKSFGDKCFHPIDVARMRKVAELFPGSFLVFAALKDTLHADEKAAIAELAQWGREPLDDGRPRAPVIVLTGTELFCSWHILNTWKVIDGKRKAIADSSHFRLDNLWTLADVTQQVYLDMMGRSEELRRKWDEQAAKAAKNAKRRKRGK